jgi:hypothetical protein
MRRLALFTGLIAGLALATGLPKLEVDSAKFLTDTKFGQDLGTRIEFKPVADRVYEMRWKFSTEVSPLGVNNGFQLQLYSNCVAGYVTAQAGYSHWAMTAMVDDDIYFKKKYTSYLVVLNAGESPAEFTGKHGRGWSAAVPREGGIGATLCPKIVKPDLLWF